MAFKFNTIEEILQDLREGKNIILAMVLIPIS